MATETARRPDRCWPLMITAGLVLGFYAVVICWTAVSQFNKPLRPFALTAASISGALLLALWKWSKRSPEKSLYAKWEGER